MHRFLHGLLRLVLNSGGPGLLVLGILDSSFLFAPLGNDLLVVALVAQHPSLWRVLYYTGMSTMVPCWASYWSMWSCAGWEPRGWKNTCQSAVSIACGAWLPRKREKR